MGKLVLSDELFVLYQGFHHQDNPNKKVRKQYDKLLENIALPIKTNATQINRCKERLNESRYNELMTTYLSSDNKETLEQLAQQTLYKLILTADPDTPDLPYLNINHSLMSKRFGITIEARQSREVLVDYLEQLLLKAKKVTICDNYFADNWENTAKFFRLLPRCELNITFVESAPNTASQSNSAQFNPENIPDFWHEWTVSSNTDPSLSGRHDRYLIINEQLEVMLSSGFDYLWNDRKEISIFLKPINN